MRPFYRDLAFGLAVQVFALFFAASILDMGQFGTATMYLSTAYWAGVVLIWVR